ncbi:MAG TPA: glycosyltransferase family A protein, partial [Bacillota bacterium]|nr:glycosyltransferase family A protein [Bacillota bacterium]
MNEQKVSVVMPNYNGEKHIKQAIDSVLGQTYENLELIIVDDNSSDGSKNIIEAYDDKRLKKVYSSFNRHVSYTVNLGFAEADGEFIARIDSDDI